MSQAINNQVNYEIRILEVLYEFNEPLLFIGQVGFHKSLFVKTDEIDDFSEYLSCYIDEAHVQGLKDGRISILGVFEKQSEKFIVIADHDLRVQNEYIASEADLAQGRLPKSGVGLYPRFGECPDALQDQNSFLTVYFKGGSLSRGYMPYSTMMNLLGSVQNFARGVVMPEELKGSKSSTFDFMVKEPEFGSLMISIAKPVYNFDRIRKADAFDKLSALEIDRELESTKDRFLSGVEDLIGSAGGRNIPKDEEMELEVFSAIRYLLPSEDTAYASVTFSTETSGSIRRLSFDRERSDSVRKTFENRKEAVLNRQGTIIEINAGSCTILLRSTNGTTTCRFEYDIFQNLRRDPNFKIGSHMRLRGDLTERPRRDYLVVRQVLELTAAARPAE